jgi:ABC-2 type transport system ATP-binding protein
MRTQSDVLKSEKEQGAPLLQVSDLTKVYQSRRRRPVTAVDRVSFEVSRGEVVGLLGRNGAGKTTTIKCICTLVKPESGSISVDGIDAVAKPRQAVANVAAVLEGNRNIYWRMTTEENIEFFAALNGVPPKRSRPRAKELIEVFRLTEAAKADTRTLSRGMQQKVAVACAFAKETPLLLLDEPTLGLDVETSFELRQRLKEMAAHENKAILLSSHDMDVVQETCERVIIIADGRVVTDDRVANLLELFKARAYRFTLSGSLPASQREELTANFPMMKFDGDGQFSTIDVELLDSGRFYELVDLLRKYECEIESIDRQDPDLEEIFLRIVKGEAR